MTQGALPVAATRRRSLIRAVFAAAVAPSLLSRAQPLPQHETRAASDSRVAGHRLLRVGRDRALSRISIAASRAQSGDVVEIDAGEYADDPVIWKQGKLTIRAVGGRARLTQSAGVIDGKGIWVIQGDDVLIENIDFAGARVVDRNGAGIRHEGGKLTIRNCLFEHNEMGLLTSNDPGAELVVEQSEFRHNAVDLPYQRGGPIGHQLYVGSIARFVLRDSYVHGGSFGHLVKSRAKESRVFNNRITDDPTGKASYELEFPNGGVAYVIGNIIQQSTLTENSDVVSFGAEGYRWPRNELYLVNNTLIDGLPAGGNFLRVRDGADEVRVINNVFLGAGRFDAHPGWRSMGNSRAGSMDVPNQGAGDYRLARSSNLTGSAVDPGSANGVDLAPDREYVSPMRSLKLSVPIANPGALQSVAP